SAEFLKGEGFEISLVPCDREGRISAAEMRRAVHDDTILIAVQHSNPEVGSVQPISEIAAIAAERGITLFSDAVASAGWLALDAKKLNASLVSISPSRFGGPRGVGILYRHRRARLENLLHGGKQEGGLRAGSENIAAIVGAGAACELAAEELEANAKRAAALQRKLIEGLARIGAKLNGPEPGPARLPNSVNASFEGIDGESLVLTADLQGIALASGPSCLAKNLTGSHVLAAMGVPKDLARGNILMTLGGENTDEDVAYVLEVFPKLVEKLRAMSPSARGPASGA
ncbi:MAG: aminotransferase class V-fold PLP-dependent enzyme, partial [Verrucomicrobiae bacterium]|nr:aminotransferase class V-fold PLP-dependent enzyme [Verrucomicrobiae bacterium]